MTITINKILLFYWLFAIVFETVYCYITFKIGWKQFKKSIETYEYVMLLISQIKQMHSVKFLWKQIVNPFSFMIGYIIFCIVAPLLLPYSFVKLFNKIIGYKSPFQKKSEAEENAIKEAQKKSEEWMKNEVG